MKSPNSPSTSILAILLLLFFSSGFASARTISDEELRSRAMDQGRTLQSRIRALKKLYAHMLVDGEIPARTTCVWDVLGTHGPIYNTALDQQLRMKHYGITMNVMAFKDESEVVEKLKNGECDSAVISGAQARQFNDFTGSIEALGGVPSEEHMKLLLQVISSPQAAKKMQQDNYVILGVVPIGFNYLFTHQEKRPTIMRVFDGKAAVVTSDVTQNALFNEFLIPLVPAPSNNEMARKFNTGDANVLMSPLVGYHMFGLSKRIRTGTIVDYPLSQMTLQVVGRLDRIPPEVAQLLREDLLIKLNFMYREVEKNTRDIPKEKFRAFSERESKEVEQRLAYVRDKLIESGEYNASMMKLQRNIRCKFDRSRDECVKR